MLSLFDKSQIIQELNDAEYIVLHVYMRFLFCAVINFKGVTSHWN